MACPKKDRALSGNLPIQQALTQFHFTKHRPALINLAPPSDMRTVADEALLATSHEKLIECERMADAVALQVEAVPLGLAKKLDVGRVEQRGTDGITQRLRLHEQRAPHAMMFLHVQVIRGFAQRSLRIQVVRE